MGHTELWDAIYELREEAASAKRVRRLQGENIAELFGFIKELAGRIRKWGKLLENAEPTT